MLCLVTRTAISLERILTQTVKCKACGRGIKNTAVRRDGAHGKYFAIAPTDKLSNMDKIDDCNKFGNLFRIDSCIIEDGA
jgi:hypothetical protein